MPLVAIVGAGMAGCATALWCKRLGLAVDWRESTARVGGQLTTSIRGPIPDYPGLPAGDGSQFAAALAAQLADADLAPELSSSVKAIGADGVELDDGSTVDADFVVVCTGVRPRVLDLDGEDELMAARLLTTSGRRDVGRALDRDVIVVGGGDGAIENAQILADRGAKSVTIVHRRAELRAREELVDRLPDAVNVVLGRELTALEADGDDAVTATLSNGDELHAGLVLYKLGFAPASVASTPALECDDAGFIVVDQCQRTSRANVFAAGDVCTPLTPSLAVAGGQAMIAAKTIARS